MNQLPSDIYIRFAVKPTVHNFLDLEGRKIGHLQVLGFLGTLNNSSRWLCRCDCGRFVSRPPRSMDGSKTHSCGCVQRELHGNRLRTLNATHRLSKSPEHRSWAAMKARCLNPNAANFRLYGERGIRICDRWIHSFENFFEDMGRRPEGKSLERIDNNGNYEPGNCMWATATEQMNNRRTTRYVEVNGELMPLETACRKFGINSRAARNRLRRGWSDTDAVMTPIRRRKP